MGSDATYSVMGINNNGQESGGINKNFDVTDEQEPREIFTNTNVTDSDTDTDMGLNNDAIFKN